MKEFRILIRNNDIYYHESMFVHGQAPYVDLPICLRIKDIFFPDEDWTDMVYPMIYQWIENLLSHKGQNNVKYSLFFWTALFL